MKICSHVITHDAGVAPNPFHDYCTTALCTPSHMNARLEQDDWLIGNSSKRDGNRLVYAMRISTVLSMNQYFADPRFERKKPKPDGTIIEQRGDNLYYQNEKGVWRRLASPFHNDPKSLRQDPGHPVFVAELFYYFGRKRQMIPRELGQIIQSRQGFHYTTGSLADDFVCWLEANFKSGLLGTPRDMAESTGADCLPVDCVPSGARQSKPEIRADCRPDSRSMRKTHRGKGGCR
jgi:hypothetical protein